MEKKQNSIDSFVKQLKKQGLLMTEDSEYIVAYLQAKAMHKEEVQNAYRISPNNELWSNSGIDYYNETFGGDNE